MPTQSIFDMCIMHRGHGQYPLFRIVAIRILCQIYVSNCPFQSDMFLTFLDNLLSI
jgi:hypothetical protein